MTIRLIPHNESGIRTPDIPTLAEMIRAGRASADKIKRASKDALLEWFAQSERLNIARIHYQLRGDRYVDFAKRIGIDRTSAFELVKLLAHRAAVLAKCHDLQQQASLGGSTFSYPGWETALGWFVTQRKAEVHNTVTWQHTSDSWGSPQALFDFLDYFYRFDVDVCATAANTKCKTFFSERQDGLKQPWTPGQAHWMNPPYSKAGAWAQKGSDAARAGAIVVGLFANRSSSRWYRDYLVPHALIVQLHGRLAIHCAATLASCRRA
jgi:site-specific DNA-methyltransferase (adenine-specific)